MEESPEEIGLGGAKCMLNCVIYYPGATNALEAEKAREVRPATWATQVVGDCFDECGRPGAKIIYVDIGDYGTKEGDAAKYISTIMKTEEEKSKIEGRHMPRLIFVKQDRDYWPGSEKDPEVMARRAAKEESYQPNNMQKPDFCILYVAPFHAEEALEHSSGVFYDAEGYARSTFRRYLDPSLPGTKFIVENFMWKFHSSFLECMMIPDLREKWMSSCIADCIPPEIAAEMAEQIPECGNLPSM